MKKISRRCIVIGVLGVLVLCIVSIYIKQRNQNAWIENNPNCDPETGGCWAPEEHGKIAVAKLPEVQALAEKYGSSSVKISALYYKYIEDENYIKRLLGGEYTGIDCLIPVESPEGKVLYVETINDGVENYHPIAWSDFERMIQDVSHSDKDIFFSNINDEQKFVRQYLP